MAPPQPPRETVQVKAVRPERDHLEIRFPRVFHLTHRLLYTKWRDPGEPPKMYLFGQLERITKAVAGWLSQVPGQLGGARQRLGS